MELSLTVLNQVVIILLLMLVGYVSVKMEILKEQGIKQFTTFVLYFVTPCVLIEAYQKEFNIEKAKLLGVAFLMAILLHVIVIVISNLVFRPNEDKTNRINIFACAYSNCGFMAIPLLSTVLGDEGVFYGSAYLAVFSILTWTHGVYVYSRDKKRLSFKRAFINPGVLGTLISLVLFVFSIKLPSYIGQTVSYIADLNTPLAMIIVGTFLAGVNVKELIKNKSFYLVTFIRLILAPLISVYLLKLFRVDLSIIKALTITAACPVAGITALWASIYGLDAKYASPLVSVTTVLSVITIPLVVILI